MFMLDLLDKLPWIWLSDDHLKTIMWIMQECGTPNVPSFSALCKKQAKLTHKVNVATEPHTSAMGNHLLLYEPSILAVCIGKIFQTYFISCQP